MPKSSDRYHHYVDWRQKRIKKIINVMGEDFFRDASGLELACLFGDIGAALHRKYNCNMTFTDVRYNHMDSFQKNNPKQNLRIIDQNQEWLLGRQYDFVIHWGVLYHLQNWQQDLKCTLRHSKVIFLESEVSDSLDPNFEIKVEERSEELDQAYHGIGSRPSSAYIEKVLNLYKANWKRYDDADINSSLHRYDWVCKETKTWSSGLRRFWIIDNR